MSLQSIEQPFSSTSIWNTPVGQGATFQSASGTETAALQHTSGVIPWIGADAITVYQAKASDPLTTWNYDSRADTTAWANGGQTWGGSFQMHTPDALKFQTVDGWSIIVSEDGKHFYETWLGSYNASSNTYHTNFIAENDLTGTGIAPAPGEHDGVRAAGLSLFGGLVRDQELNNLDIPHAIAMAISTTQLKSGSEASSQYTWPATTVDGGSTGSYTGSIPMGALFAIPKSVDLSKIGLTSAEGLALAKAYQNYGGYVVDNAGDRTDNLAYVETGATQTQIDHLQADIATIRDHLAMVTNNSAADPGGPGAPVGGGTTAPAAPAPAPTPTAPVVPAPTAPATPAPTASAATVGTGSDALVLKMSQDAYKGDAHYTVSVDGHQIGGTITAHASHAAGQHDTLTVKGDWAAGNHDVAVNFVNDANGGASGDRNLYVDSATYNGAAVANSKLALPWAGPQHIAFHDGAVAAPTPTTPTPAKPTPTGSDALVLKISQDAYKGDAQYTISVDGKQVDGVHTAHASHASGKSDTVSVHGDWGAGDHQVSVNFLNDKWDGTPSTDRNLYVDGATYNGVAVAHSKTMIAVPGPEHFTVHDATAVPADASLLAHHYAL